MADHICSVDGCVRNAVARGWCHLHYKRWIRHGNPLIKKVPRPSPSNRACDGCAAMNRVVSDWRGTGVVLCGTCRSARNRREQGVAARTRRTQEQRRMAAAESARRRHLERRALIIKTYGGHCACCGEDELAFLGMDHIAGGGNAHRRSLTSDGSIAGSPRFYFWIIHNDFPDELQVLCHNCNFAKSHGGCPHGNC